MESREAKRERWCRVLTERGATPRQARTAWLIHTGLENKEIATLQGISTSTVTTDIQVLRALLGVRKRKRQALKDAAWRLVEAEGPTPEPPAAPPPAPAAAVQPPEPKLPSKKAPRSSSPKRSSSRSR